jgi:hypothetical protein
MQGVILAESILGDLEPYFDRLDERVCAEGEEVPFNPNACIGDWKPAVGGCHRNADRWATIYRENAAVRGWGTWGRDAGSERKFFAHSVVSEGATLIDITPLGNEVDRGGMIFLRHVGTEAEYFEIEKRCCFCFYPQDFLPRVLLNEPPVDDEGKISEIRSESLGCLDGPFRVA